MFPTGETLWSWLGIQPWEFEIVVLLLILAVLCAILCVGIAILRAVRLPSQRIEIGDIAVEHRGAELPEGWRMAGEREPIDPFYPPPRYSGRQIV